MKRIPLLLFVLLCTDAHAQPTNITGQVEPEEAQ